MDKIISFSLLILSIILFIISCIFVYKLENINEYDVNRDGKVNSQDYVLIKNYIMNKD